MSAPVDGLIDLTNTPSDEEDADDSAKLRATTRRLRRYGKTISCPIDLTFDDSDEDEAVQQEHGPPSKTLGKKESKRKSKKCVSKPKSKSVLKDNNHSKVRARDASAPTKPPKVQVKAKPKEINSKKLRAHTLLEEINTTVEPFSKKGIEPIGKGDVFISAEMFVECHSSFEQQSKSSHHVSIGYLYLTQEAKTSDALLRKTDCYSPFGIGIYVGTNPLAFSRCGPYGLLVAIIKGAVQDIRTTPEAPRSLSADTIVANTTGKSPFEDQIVLRKSFQVLPLAKFSLEGIKSEASLDALWSVHEKLQSILDKHFNKSIRTLLTRVLPPPPRVQGSVTYSAPFRLGENEIPHHSVDPTNLKKSDNEFENECPICFDDMVHDVVQLNVCPHRFHQYCLKGFMASESQTNEPTCPMCRKSVKEPRGQSPSGRMDVKTSSLCGSLSHIVVSYSILGGTQLPYQPSPYSAFKGLHNFGPIEIENTDAGRKLLKRLEYAFKRGLSFEVVRVEAETYPLFEAKPTGHMASLTAKVDSWSDSSFFERCNHELDSLGVPLEMALQHDQGIKFD